MTSSPKRQTVEESHWSQHNACKHPASTVLNAVPAKRPLSALPRQQPENTSGNDQKFSSKLPACLKKLVRSIVRTFYSREHSLIVDMLVRNTIMKEDDLCDRLKFEKKQLRQYLHTLKTDQFIKSKLQLETDAEGKTTKITHYFIDYKLFVNVVKYRLDQMRRRLEAEQRQTTSRASFRCISCGTTYTDLEVDRLISLDTPGRLECVYCRAEVAEEEDNVSRTDARALIASFHHQVRDPIDAMLRECDEIHLSSSILEPEIRPLEHMKDESESTTDPFGIPKSPVETNPTKDMNSKPNSTPFGSAENKVRIVLSGKSNCTPAVKQRPVWMCDSTVNSGPFSGFGELDRGSGIHASTSNTENTVTPASTMISDSVTQTLTPGRVPTGFSAPNSSGPTSAKEPLDATGSVTSGPSSGGDIMQLLMIHERRGLSSHLSSKSNQSSTRIHINEQSVVKESRDDAYSEEFTVTVGGRSLPYSSITAQQIRTMSTEEKDEYIRVGKLVYNNLMD